jgi:predicted transcriptional regulator
MLIERKAVAVRTLSCRTDEEMYTRTIELAASLRTDPSTIMRLALAHILERADKQHSKSIMELTPDAF